MKPFQRKDRDGWFIRFKEPDGRWVTRKGGSTEGEAWAALDRAEKKAMAIREGWADPDRVEAAEGSRRPIGEVIAEYKQYLQDNRRSPAHIKTAIGCIKAVTNGIGAKDLASIQVRPVEKWLGALLRKGRSARTHNVYLMRTSAMLNWAVKRRMAVTNPLLVIDKLSEQGDKREVSRAITPEEFNRLIEKTPDEDRKLYYLVAGRCGLRWSEIRRLRWQDIDLENGWIRLDASNTKSRRGDSIPLCSDVLAALKARPKRMGTIFDSSPTIRTWKSDLERAKIEYDNEHGQVDRKSLRKTFCTHLAVAGVDLRTAGKLMRHTDLRLTQNIYTDPALLDMKAAVEKLNGSADHLHAAGNDT
jgi:integrase